MPAIGRTATGGYPRGEETKQRIVDVAIEMFGRHGYRGASTRDIAVAAGVNTPAIQYYFDGKPGLYQASVSQTVDMIWGRLGPAIALCETRLLQQAPDEEIFEALGDVQDCMINSFFADDEGKRIWRLLAWNDIDGVVDNAGSLMRNRIGLPIYEIFEKVVSHVATDVLTNIEIEMTAFSLMGLSTVFHMDKGRVVQNMLWHNPNDEQLNILRNTVRENLKSVLLRLRT